MVQGPGEQPATITRLSPFSFIMSVISLAELVAHENNCSERGQHSAESCNIQPYPGYYHA